MNVDEQEIGELMSVFANGMKQAAPEMADFAKTLFDELVEAGFDDDQALELVKHMDNQANFQQ